MWDNLFSQMANSVNSGFAKAVLTLIGGAVVFVPIWLGEKAKFAALQQEAIALMAHNNAALSTAKAQCDMLTSEMAHALSRVPSGGAKERASGSLQTARKIPEQLDKSALAPRSGVSIDTVERLKLSGKNKRLLRYLIVSERVSEAQLEKQPWKFAIDKIREDIDGINKLYGDGD
jgi:hypothetical protein